MPFGFDVAVRSVRDVRAEEGAVLEGGIGDPGALDARGDDDDNDESEDSRGSVSCDALPWIVASRGALSTTSSDDAMQTIRELLSDSCKVVVSGGKLEASVNARSGGEGAGGEAVETVVATGISLLSGCCGVEDRLSSSSERGRSFEHSVCGASPAGCDVLASECCIACCQ